MDLADIKGFENAIQQYSGHKNGGSFSSFLMGVFVSISFLFLFVVYILPFIKSL